MSQKSLQQYFVIILITTVNFEVNAIKKNLASNFPLVIKILRKFIQQVWAIAQPLKALINIRTAMTGINDVVFVRVLVP